MFKITNKGTEPCTIKIEMQPCVITYDLDKPLEEYIVTLAPGQEVAPALRMNE